MLRHSEAVAENSARTALMSGKSCDAPNRIQTSPSRLELHLPTSLRQPCDMLQRPCPCGPLLVGNGQTPFCLDSLRSVSGNAPSAHRSEMCSATESRRTPYLSW